MFYINQFFKIIKSSIFKGVLFLFVSISFVLVLGNWTLLKEKIVDLYPDYMKGPSFYALVAENEDYLNIQRKLISLPGVSSVKILDKEFLQKQTEKILNNFELKPEEIAGISYIGLEVMFDKNINDRGQELIKSYLGRLAGETNITVGKTRVLPEKDNIKILMDFINDGGALAVGLFFVVIWFISLFIIKKEVKKASYLIEQFQRKKSVEFKILFSGTLLVYFISMGFVAIAPSPEWINIIGIGFFFMIALAISGGRRSWES